MIPITLVVKSCIGEPLSNLNNVAQNIGDFDEDNDWVLQGVEINRWLNRISLKDAKRTLSDAELDQAEAMVKSFGIHQLHSNIRESKRNILQIITELKKMPEAQRVLTTESNIQ